MNWDADGWSYRFKRASAAGKGFRELCVEVLRASVDAVHSRGYSGGDESVSLDLGDVFEGMRPGTVMYPETDDPYVLA